MLQLNELKLFFALTGMNIKRVLSYRLDFVMGFVGRTFAIFVTSYFLWSLIFKTNGATSIGGFKFEDLVLYYLLIPVTSRAIQGNEMSLIYAEIYDGSVAKYLVYPASFFSFRYAYNFASCLLAVAQAVFVIVLFGFFKPEIVWDLAFWGRFAIGLTFALAASWLYFSMVAVWELVAFWQDQVWSLVVMQRFLLAFLGGSMIPLPLLPEPLRKVCLWLPFYYVGGFAAEFIVRPLEAPWTQALAVFACWTVIYFIVMQLIWKQGLKKFSGVGQ